MDDVEAKKSWYQFKQLVKLQAGPGVFFEGVNVDDFSLVSDTSTKGNCSANVINCTFDRSGRKIICKPFTISNTCKEFQKKTEIALCSESKAAAKKVLDLFDKLSGE